jgi:hypothetical protein
MPNVFRIKPLHKKSVYATYELYRNNPDDTVSWFTVEELWRWGEGYIEEEMECNLPYRDSTTAICQSQAHGVGSEFDDSINVDFDFSDDLTEEEKEHIQDCYLNGDPNDEYERGGAAWIYDGDHGWEIEDEYVTIMAPFTVDLCDSDGNIIKENIELQERSPLDKNAAWPFK